jgi:cytochrome d ubiquinol oxidase subunit II
MEALQIYWWLVISLLGGLLVFLMFVQGGQTMILSERNADRKSLIVNVLGRKWELTFTTLVTFGGAFFASFPLYYSTSFGGAYWLWMLILLSFILQAVSYEFRSKPGNIFGTKTYDWFLCINGCVGCILLGEAVAMQFFGADFTIARGNILDASSPVISHWNNAHGLDVIFSAKNLLLGFAVFFLARTMAALFFIKGIADKQQDDFLRRQRTQVLINGTVFVVLFLAFLAVLFLSDGYTQTENGTFEAVANKYFWNFIDLWWIGVAFVVGVLMVLYGVIRGSFDKKFSNGFWWAGIGVVIAVTSLISVSGYNNTAYLPSLADPQSSLTIANSSSSEFTLTVMSWVTVLLPFVIAYIAYVWHKMTSPRISSDELSSAPHKY